MKRPAIWSNRYYWLCLTPFAIWLVLHCAVAIYLPQTPWWGILPVDALLITFWMRFISWTQGYRYTIWSKYEIDQPYVIRCK